MALFKPAVREKIKVRTAIDGPTGSGKTWTALQWAMILSGNRPDAIGLIDTESRSALRYTTAPGETPERLHPFDPPYQFGHLPADPPFNPVELGRLIDAAGAELGPDGVLIIDSLTHYWNGEGGTLSIVDDAETRNSNRFSGWKEGTPAQRFMLDRMLRCRCHLIVTMRSKMEYVLEEIERKGRTVQAPKRIGMAPEQRAGIEYEFDLMASMDQEHRLVVTKSRIPALADLVAQAGRSFEVAEQLALWLATGADKVTADEAATLKAAMNGIEPEAVRKAVKTEFVTRWGLPDDLLATDYEPAFDWLEHRLTPSPEPVTAATTTPEPNRVHPMNTPDLPEGNVVVYSDGMPPMDAEPVS